MLIVVKCVVEFHLQLSRLTTGCFLLYLHKCTPLLVHQNQYINLIKHCCVLYTVHHFPSVQLIGLHNNVKLAN